MPVFGTRADSVVLDGERLTVEAVRRVAEQDAEVTLTEGTLAGVRRSRASLEDLLRKGVPVEGVTLFRQGGRWARVDAGEEHAYQTNLVRAHSTGIGPLFAEDEARAIVSALLNSLAKGYSAVRPQVLERLARYLNQGIVPSVPELGSLGAGGDSVPLAHIASALIGEGHVLRDGRRTETALVLRELGLRPLRLRFKEGQALIGGSAATTGLGSLVVARALDQVRQAEIVAALLAGALGDSAGSPPAAGHPGHPHRGQIDTAANLRDLLRGGEPPDRPPAGRTSALRAAPQVLGAVRHTLYQAVSTLESELNSAGDDPLFFDGREVAQGANGHGQPVAFAMDFVTIALVQLGVLAERQLSRLLSRGPDGALPTSLVATDPVLHHGFAAAQYPATALVAENRTIGPASTQSVPAAGDGPDIAGMGLVAARGTRRVLENNNRILAVVLLAAVQAVDVGRRFDELGTAARAAYDMVRSLVPPLGVDRSMAGDIELITTALSRGEVLREVCRTGTVALR